MPLSKDEIAALLARLPDTDEPGQESKFTGPEPQAAQKIFEEILAGGPETIAELIRLLHTPADSAYKDYRPEYVLHGLAVYAGHPEREEQRRVLSDSFGSPIRRNDLPKGVRGCLIRELQWVSGKEAVEAIASGLQDEELCEYAISALTAIGPSAAEALRRVLPQARGKARLAILQALGVLGDTAAAGVLRDAAGDESRDIRIAAVWGLAHIGDAGSVNVLLKAADAQDGWERIQAAKGCLLLAEKLLAAGKKTDAAKIYAHLQETRQDPAEQYVRDAAAKGLAVAK